MEVSLLNATFLYCACKPTPAPPREGMLPHRGSLSKMLYVNEEFLIVRCVNIAL
jgi:hypothetical protein